VTVDFDANHDEDARRHDHHAEKPQPDTATSPD